ncbi:acyltransferase [Massilia sp. TWP1-3-3]|uniref:acyltransferase n=1 Tax=Massilia sp. TWP1-3-3 TaxID=2804573 RepID=UPI003CF25C24
MRLMRLLSKAYDKLFYDPYTLVRKNPFIRIGNSRLGKSFRVTFLTPREQDSFVAGNDCILYCQIFFESAAGNVELGERVYIGDRTQFISRSSIKVGSDVLISWGCTIYDHDAHSIDYRHRMADHAGHLQHWESGALLTGKDWSTVNCAPITIGDHAWIGFDVVILKGVTIGEGAVIGARSVVTSDIPAWSVAVGSPARVVKTIPTHLRKPHANIAPVRMA